MEPDSESFEMKLKTNNGEESKATGGEVTSDKLRIYDEISSQRSLLKTRSHSLFAIEHGSSSDRHPLLKHAISEEQVSPSYHIAILPSGEVPPTKNYPKVNRVSRRSRKLNTLLLEAVMRQDVREIERLIRVGANPNATCTMDNVSACHIAAMREDDALSTLLRLGAEKQRSDRFGRTPLHLAAWAGNVRQIAILLGFSNDLQNRVAVDEMSQETRDEVRKLGYNVKDFVDVRCVFVETSSTIPKEWQDSPIDHNCKEFVKTLPLFQAGWTALLAASAHARPQCVKLLLAASADICTRDFVGRTSLDVAGSAYYAGENIDSKAFAEVVSICLSTTCKNITLRSTQNYDTPLHTAVELNSLDAIKALIEADAPIDSLNRAGMTPLHLCVKKKLKEHLQVLLGHLDAVASSISVEVRDKDERTVLHTAVVENWVVGVCVALEAGAKITSKDRYGETPLHLAAEIGNLDILNQILSFIDDKDVIDTPNPKRETALFKAVINGHTDCVKKILHEGSSIKKTLSRQVNVFHKAAENGHAKLLKVLLDHDYNITRGMVNFLTVDDRKGYGPIHFAVQNNHCECVKVLLSSNAYVCLKTSYGVHRGMTPLHLAAINNNVEIAKIILNFDTTTVNVVDHLGWSPLHTASHYGSRDMIVLLLKKGADLSALTFGRNKCKATAIDMIMNNLSKPTNFMEDIFDKYIYTNDLNIQDPNCEVTVAYNILVPKATAMEQMKVIDALLKTGDRYDQRRLLLHPLLESFLYLKWKALLPFFYMMIAFHGLFVMSLTTLIISVFFNQDTHWTPPMLLDANAWTYVVYFTVCLIVIQEILYMNISSRYLLQLETWVKFGAISLAVILPASITEMKRTGAEWPRHVATVALLLAWMEMTFLLSRFPNWGYYVLMFAKVSANVVKILLTFAFLVIGFSLSFMVQFHSQIPFENPWAALVKTMVMMTSEFDYDDLVEKDNDKDAKVANSLLTVRLIFLAFLVLAAIVLMNLMVGVAVNDLHNLQVLGNIRRLTKQVEFLGSLEYLVYNSYFKKILPDKLDNKLRNNNKVLSLITLRPSEPSSKYYKALPTHIREAIFEKAQCRKIMKDEELGTLIYKKKLDEIHEAIVKKLNDGGLSKCNNNTMDNKDREDLVKRINDLSSTVTDLNTNINTILEILNPSTQK